MIGFITTPFWTRGTLLVRTSPSTWLFNFWMWSGRLFLCTNGFTLLLLGGDFIWGLGSEAGFGGAAGTGLGLMLASFSLFCPTILTTQTYNYKTELSYWWKLKILTWNDLLDKHSVQRRQGVFGWLHYPVDDGNFPSCGIYCTNISLQFNGRCLYNYFAPN